MLGGAQATVPVAVQVSQKHLILVQGQVRRRVDLASVFQGYELKETKLLHSTSDAKARYLVIYIAGPSRSPMAALSFCGAGTEGYLVWLMFDPAWCELKRQSALIESCFESAEGRYEFKAGRLTAAWENYRLEKHFELAYNANAAAGGFSISETKIEPAK